MARLPRYAIPGQPLHAIQRGNNRTDIFKSPQDYAFFRECLLDCVKGRPWSVHAYAQWDGAESMRGQLWFYPALYTGERLR